MKTNFLRRSAIAALTLTTASFYFAQEEKQDSEKSIDEVVLVGVADIAKDRKTPVAVSTIKEGAIVEKLAAHGAKMVISCDMGESSYEQANVVHKILNVTDREAIKTFVDEVEKEYGKIDVLVNNAGITKDGLLMRMTEDQWDAVINVNLKGVFNMTQAVSRSMLKARKGSIITLSSVVGLHGNPGQTNYAATKGGVIAMSKTWAKEFGARNVRANCVAPGFVQTPMTDVLPEETIKGMLDATPLGRLGQVEDIANAVLFLASDESAFITGEVLSVSGGLML